MSEAIVVQSEKGFGCVIVIERDGSLAGIVTDGDLRRHMGPGLLTMSVEQVMTRNPTVITAHTLLGEARWKVIANQVTVAPMDFGNGPSADSWGGYVDSRDHLLGEIERAGVQNVVFLTGDAHVFMVNLLASDEEAFRSDPQHHPAAVEYVGGSVTSPGGQRSEADVQSMNPWNRQFNSEQHGYAYMAADESQLVTEYRRSNIASPRGATTAFERFTQPTGVNNVTRESIPAPIPPPPPPGPEPSTARQV